MPTVKLTSSDGVDFTVDMKVALLSGTIKTMLEDLQHDEKSDVEEPIPLLNVNYIQLEKILKWATYHMDDPEFVLSKDDKEKKIVEIGHWDREFIKNDISDKRFLFQLIEAANYLNITALMNVLGSDLANKIKGNTPEEIRNVFDTDYIESNKKRQKTENEPSTSAMEESKPSTSAMEELEPSTSTMEELEPLTSAMEESKPSTSAMEELEPSTSAMEESKPSTSAMEESQML